MFAGMAIRNFYGLWHASNPHTAFGTDEDLEITDGIVTDPRHPDNVLGPDHRPGQGRAAEAGAGGGMKLIFVRPIICEETGYYGGAFCCVAPSERVAFKMLERRIAGGRIKRRSYKSR